MEGTAESSCLDLRVGDREKASWKWCESFGTSKPSPTAHLLQPEQPPNPFLTVPLTRNQKFQLWAYGKGSAHSPQSSNADSETSQTCLFFLLILSLWSRFTIFSIEFVLLFNCSHSFWNSWVYSWPIGLESLNPLMLYPLSSHWNLLLWNWLLGQSCAVFHISYFSKLSVAHLVIE